MSSPKKNNTALLSLRAAVVLMGALIICAIIGGLTYLKTHQLADTGLAGFFAFSAGLTTLNALIGT